MTRKRGVHGVSFDWFTGRATFPVVLVADGDDWCAFSARRWRIRQIIQWSNE